MKEDLIKIRILLSKVKPWVAVAVLLATLVVGYYGVLGARYLKVSQEFPSLTSQIQQLARGPRGQAPEEQLMMVELESTQLRLDELQSLFDYPETDDLMAIMSDTAREIPLVLRSITIGDASTEILNGTLFQVQPVNVKVKGKADSIYGFMLLLQEKIPVIVVTSIRLSDIDAKPNGQIDFVVYLSPEAESEDEAG